jgi:DNA-directed RNA polymerase subunit RPC12/RpoP
MTHELIDKNEPKCLYCNSEIFYELKSDWLPNTSLKVDSEIITCHKCKEEFKIHSLQGSDGVTEYTGFTFTCKSYCVFFNYIESYFDISDKKGKHIVAIPSFTVDFSDKNKLYDKLKTYLIFS